MRILLIDDEPLYHKMIARAVEKEGYELKSAHNGAEGLAAIPSFQPAMIILDLQLPDMNGFEILQRLRRDPSYGNIPVIFLTAKNLLEDKLKAFDLGADDYMVKPFQPEELVARLGILARRGKAIQYVQQSYEDTSTLVAVHSLRGGSGTSSLAVNLALALYNIWNKPTIVMDAVLAAGQVAMMLNGSPRATWGELADIEENTNPLEDEGLLDSLVSQHSSGLSYIAAPKYPIATDTFNADFWGAMIEKYKQRADFVVMDTAHDFSDVTISMLNGATDILLVVNPDMASLRAADSALNIYDRLGYLPDKVRMVLNYNSNYTGIKQPQLEKVLGHQFDYVIPFEANEVFRAINFGEPFILKNYELGISVQLEDIAYKLSNVIHKNIPPAAPTPTWKRVTNRKQREK